MGSSSSSASGGFSSSGSSRAPPLDRAEMDYLRRYHHGHPYSFLIDLLTIGELLATAFLYFLPTLAISNAILKAAHLHHLSIPDILSTIAIGALASSLLEFVVDFKLHFPYEYPWFYEPCASIIERVDKHLPFLSATFLAFYITLGATLGSALLCLFKLNRPASERLGPVDIIAAIEAGAIGGCALAILILCYHAIFLMHYTLTRKPDDSSTQLDQEEAGTLPARQQSDVVSRDTISPLPHTGEATGNVGEPVEAPSTAVVVPVGS